MAKLTTSERAALPDHCFALPELREFPLTDANGRLDEDHVGPALARLQGSAKGLTAKQRSLALRRIIAARMILRGHLGPV